jgi:hypothetical protein
LDRRNLVQSVQRIYATNENEIDCERLQELLPIYVEVELSGADPNKQFPAVHSHLVQCSDCAEEYKGLRQVVKLAVRGELPKAEESLAQFQEEKVPAA